MSIRKRTWKTEHGEKTAWVVDYTDSIQKRRLKTFRLKKDADAFSVIATGEVRNGVHVADAASATVAEAGELWIAAIVSKGRERSTIDQYRQHIKYHIAPLIGKTKLNALTAPGVRAFKDRLRDKECSPAMIRKVMVSLGSMLADAQERGLIARNVVRDSSGGRSVSDSRAEKRAKGKLKIGVDIPAPSEVKTIISVLSGRWRPILLTAIFTGLRASELRGLRWSDVNLEKSVLRVHQRADRYNALGKPKSEAAEREVPLPSEVVKALREWKLICPMRETGKRADDGGPLQSLDLVFPNGKGKIEFLANFINRGLVPVQIAAGVTVETDKVDENGKPLLAARYTGLHALRHFYASWCINRREDNGLGLTPKMVQDRLGHASINLTMDRYAHLFPREEDHKELAEAERFFF